MNGIFRLNLGIVFILSLFDVVFFMGWSLVTGVKSLTNDLGADMSS